MIDGGTGPLFGGDGVETDGIGGTVDWGRDTGGGGGGGGGGGVATGGGGPGGPGGGGGVAMGGVIDGVTGTFGLKLAELDGLTVDGNVDVIRVPVLLDTVGITVLYPSTMFAKGAS